MILFFLIREHNMPAICLSYFCVFQECFTIYLMTFRTFLLRLLLGHQVSFYKYFSDIVNINDSDSSACILWLMELLCHLVLLHKLAVIFFVIFF